MFKDPGKLFTEKMTDNFKTTITSNPSNVIRHHNKVINIDGVSLSLTMVTMKRSFLLTIQNAGNSDRTEEISKDSIIRGFMVSNRNLNGLSLAIGEQSTCIINSDNSLDSATLASRLSKKLNLDRPVYVANSSNVPYDTIEGNTFKSKLYLKVFQFARDTFRCN